MKNNNKNQKVPENVRVKVGKNLKSIYEAKKIELGLSQNVIAERMDLTQGTVGQYLNGKTPLNARALTKFANILQTTPAEIWPEHASYLDVDLNPANAVPEAPGLDLKRTTKSMSLIQQEMWEPFESGTPEQQAKLILWAYGQF